MPGREINDINQQNIEDYVGDDNITKVYIYKLTDPTAVNKMFLDNGISFINIYSDTFSEEIQNVKTDEVVTDDTGENNSDDIKNFIEVFTDENINNIVENRNAGERVTLKTERNFSMFTNAVFKPYSPDRRYFLTVGEPYNLLDFKTGIQKVYLIQSIIGKIPGNIVSQALENNEITELRVLEIESYTVGELSRSTIVPYEGKRAFSPETEDSGISKNINFNLNETSFLSRASATGERRINFSSRIEEQRVEFPIDLYTKSSLIPFKVRPENVSDYIHLNLDWYNNDYSLSFDEAEKFLGDKNFDDKDEYFGIFPSAEPVDFETVISPTSNAYRLITDYILYSMIIIDNFGNIPLENGQLDPSIKVGSYGDNITSLQGEDATIITDRLWDRFIRENPNETKENLEYIKQLISALSRYIISKFSWAGGNNEAHKVALPWYLTFKSALRMTQVVSGGNILLDTSDLTIQLESEYHWWVTDQVSDTDPEAPWRPQTKTFPYAPKIVDGSNTETELSKNLSKPYVFDLENKIILQSLPPEFSEEDTNIASLPADMNLETLDKLQYPVYTSYIGLTEDLYKNETIELPSGGEIQVTMPTLPFGILPNWYATDDKYSAMQTLDKEMINGQQNLAVLVYNDYEFPTQGPALEFLNRTVSTQRSGLLGGTYFAREGSPTFQGITVAMMDNYYKKRVADLLNISINDFDIEYNDLDNENGWERVVSTETGIENSNWEGVGIANVLNNGVQRKLRSIPEYLPSRTVNSSDFWRNRETSANNKPLFNPAKTEQVSGVPAILRSMTANHIAELFRGNDFDNIAELPDNEESDFASKFLCEYSSGTGNSNAVVRYVTWRPTSFRVVSRRPITKFVNTADNILSKESWREKINDLKLRSNVLTQDDRIIYQLYAGASIYNITGEDDQPQQFFLPGDTIKIISLDLIWGEWIQLYQTGSELDNYKFVLPSSDNERITQVKLIFT